MLYIRIHSLNHRIEEARVMGPRVREGHRVAYIYRPVVF